MTHSFVKAMKDEIAKLEAELARDDVRFVRLQELYRLLRLYDDSQGDVTQSATPVGHTWNASQPERPRQPNRSRSSSAERQTALRYAATYVRNRATPVPTQEILDHLNGLGVGIGGKRPRNTLSAMLSNSYEFQANGREGWTLVAKKEHENFSSASEDPLFYDNDEEKDAVKDEARLGPDGNIEN